MIARYPKETSYANLEMNLPKAVDDGTPTHGFMKAKIPVSIFLIGGIRLSGLIVWHNEKVLILRHECDQEVRRDAISTVCPAAGTFCVKNAKE